MRLCVVFIQCHSVSISRYKCLLCTNLFSVKHSTESIDSAFLHHCMQDLSGTGVCGGTNNTINQCSNVKSSFSATQPLFRTFSPPLFSIPSHGTTLKSHRFSLFHVQYLLSTSLVCITCDLIGNQI